MKSSTVRLARRLTSPLALPLLILSCSAGSRPASGPVITPTSTGGVVAPAPVLPTCGEEPVLVAEGGEIEERDCPPDDAISLDLSDGWTPGLFAEVDGAAPVYRDVYLELAAADEPNAAYGVMPSLGKVRGWLADDARHQCHEAVDDAALETLEGELRGWRADRERQASRERELTRLEGREQDERTRERIAAIAPEVNAIRAVKAHLRCDGAELSDDAVLNHATLNAIETFQTRNMLLTSRRVDADTRTWMRLDSREADFRAALRVLRARITEAGGLLADGSAANAPGQILGRTLEGDAMRVPLREEALPGALPDQISEATEVAARALGWTDPGKTLAALSDLPAGPVAIAMPFSPLVNGALNMRVEIDRGDVWYDDPHQGGRRRAQPVENLPTITVFVELDGEWHPAVRWATTIGGWMKEQRGNHVAMRYEASPVGPVVWRDLVVAPVWLPPPGIPDEALMSREEGEWVADRTVVGPGPNSAYGLAMLVHHKVIEEEGESTRFVDRGIRTHGTGNLASVVDGDRDSHGCHRTFPHLILRLTDFILHHHAYTREGEVEVRYARRLRDNGNRAELEIDSRGYRIELTPPIPVEVLEGEIRGDRTEPIGGRRPLPGRR